MSKTIKLDDVTYSRLAEFQGKRETLSAAVARLLDVAVLVGKAAPMIGGAEAYWRGQIEREKAKTPDDRGGNRPEVPDV